MQMRELLTTIIISALCLMTAAAQVSISSMQGTQIEPDINGDVDLCVGEMELVFEKELGPYQLLITSPNNPDFSLEREIVISGDLDFHVESLSQLCLGTYEISVVDKLGCVTMLTSIVEDCFDAGFTDFEASVAITYATDQTDGSFQLIVDPPGQYTNKWYRNWGDLGIIATNAEVVSGVQGGREVVVEISNGCLTKRYTFKMEQCKVPETFIEVDAVVTPSIGSRNNGRIQISLENHRISQINWSSGQTTSIIENLAPGYYCFEGKTQENSCFSGCYTIESSEWAIATVEGSCEGMSNGSIVFEYQINSGKEISVFLNGLPYSLPNVTAGGENVSIPIVIENLEGPRIYSVTVVVDGNTKTFEIFVPVVDLEKTFTGLSQDNTEEEIILGHGIPTCEYDLLCKDEIIFTGLKETSSFAIGGGDSKGLTCRHVVKCGNMEYEVDVPYIKRMPKWRYTQLLDALVASQSITFEYRKILERRVNDRPDCALLRVCPADFEVHELNFIPPQGDLLFAYPIKDGKCIRYKCEGMIFNRKFCSENLSEILPEIDQPIDFRCATFRLPAVELQENLLVLQNNMSSFKGSRLEHLLVNEQFQPCDWIKFCACNFEHYDVELNLYCGEQIFYGGDVTPAISCSEIFSSQSGRTYICKNPLLDVLDNGQLVQGGFDFQLVMSVERFRDQVIKVMRDRCDRTNANQNQLVAGENDNVNSTLVTHETGYSSVMKYITGSNENEILDRFAFEYLLDREESYLAPFGIVSSEDQRVGLTLNWDQPTLKKFDIDQVDAFTFNYQSERENHSEFSVMKVSEFEYLLTFSENLLLDKWRWVSTDHINIDYSSIQDSFYMIGGQVTGVLTVDGTPFYESIDTSQFFALISTRGEILDFSTISGIKMRGSISGGDVPNSGLFLTSPSKPEIIVNGINYEVSPGDYLLFNIGDKNLSNFSAIAIGQGLEPLALASDPTGNIAIALYGNGNFEGQELIAGLHVVSLKEENSFHVITSLEGLNIETTRFDMEFETQFNDYSQPRILLGATFSNEFISDTINVTSKGGSDVLIMELDLKGDLLNYWNYGTELDETVGHICGTRSYDGSSRYIFFGGEFSSEIYQRQLGDITFINTSLGAQKAYVSYIMEDVVIPEVAVNLRAFLEGPFFYSYPDSLMFAGVIDYFPVTSPYFDSLVCDPSSFTIWGDDGVVDWVYVELRSKNNYDYVVAATSAILQRDGDIVDIDGISPLAIQVLEGEYYVTVRHRNHIPISSASPISFAGGINFDFSASDSASYGNNGSIIVKGRSSMWAGDLNGDGVINALDRAIAQDNLFSDFGYHNCDTNLDGVCSSEEQFFTWKNRNALVRTPNR